MQTTTENIAVNKIDNFAANVVDNIVINSATNITVTNCTTGSKKKRRKKVPIKDAEVAEWIKLFDKEDWSLTDISGRYDFSTNVIGYNIYKHKNIALEEKVSELEAKLAECCRTKQLLLNKIKVLEENARKAEV